MIRLFAFLFFLPALAMAQPANEPGELVIATRILPPFVLKDGTGAYSGFTPMLWQALAERAGLRYTWKEVGSVKDILAAVETGEAGIGMAAISITAEREQRFDFSQPMFESGLQILVRAENGGSGFGLGALARMFSTGALPAMIALLAGLVLIPAHAVWLAERKHDNPLFARTYIPGIFHAIWWATGATAGQQPDIPRSGFGRFVSGVSILVSVIFLAFFTAALTASITVGQLLSDIGGPDDLAGKKVATLSGSTTADYLRARDIIPVEYKRIDEAFRALDQRLADAVVFDAPVLLYYAANSGAGRARVVGPVFRRENYGILFAKDSALRKRVNEALLSMREDGSYDRLYDEWFGRANSGAK